MHDPQSVRSSNSPCHRSDKPRCFLWWQACVTVESITQGASGEIFESHVRLAIVVTVLVDADDVGVFDRGDSLGFNEKACQILIPNAVVVAHCFECDDAVQ
jgi:hypothetical protein